MREKLLVAVLSICCTLLVVNIAQLWQAAPQAAYGQSSSGTDGGYILATTVESSKPVCFVLRTGGQAQLAAYSAVQGNGIRLLGCRKIAFDLQINEYKGKSLTVKQARKLASKSK